MMSQPGPLGTPALLGGESSPGQFGFRTGDGVQIEDGSPAIFPVVKTSPDGTIDLIGTGFFVTTVGVFVTAKHVLEAVFDHRTGRQLSPPGIIHFHEKGGYLIRPVLRCAFHPRADLTVAVAAPMTRDSDGTSLTNKILTLNTGVVETGSHVMTFSFPRHENLRTDLGQVIHLTPDYYDGNVVEHLPNGRDRVLLPGPCYRTTIKIHHGASGGPVFSPDGRVFALNSTGFDGTDDSYVSGIGGILDLAIDDVVLKEGPPRSVSVREMARAGFLDVIPVP